MTSRSSGIFPRRLNWFYVPAIALFAVFSIYPLISGVSLSLTNWNGYSRSKAFIGLDNYVRLLDDEVFRTALVNTLIGTLMALSLITAAFARRARQGAPVEAVGA